MTEQKIEKTICDRLSEALAASGVERFKVFGVWQPSDGIKAEEDDSEVFATVKVHPRTYELPTIPDAQFSVEVSIIARSDVDYGGRSYLEVSSNVMEMLQSWQSSFDVAESVFSIPGEFAFTGFSMEGGECGIDRDAFLWQFATTLTIHGVIG